MQKITLAGTVGKDAVLRNASGEPVLGFSLAVNNGKDRSGNEIPSTWFDCSIWGKRAEAVARFITKGTRITVEGKLTTREHEGKTYLGCKVSDFTLQGGGQQREDAPSRDSGGASQGGGYSAPGGMDDDIPFGPQVD